MSIDPNSNNRTFWKFWKFHRRHASLFRSSKKYHLINVKETKIITPTRLETLQLRRMRKILRDCSVLCALSTPSSDGLEEQRAIEGVQGSLRLAGDILEKEVAQAEGSLESKDAEESTYISVSLAG